MTTDRYTTRRGIHVHRTVEAIPVKDAIEPVIDALDSRRGILLASSYEYPGRYTRWDMGFVDPPLVLVARGRGLRVETLNARGAVLLPAIADALGGLDAIETLDRAESSLTPSRGAAVRTLACEDEREPVGINTQAELQAVERYLLERDGPSARP